VFIARRDRGLLRHSQQAAIEAREFRSVVDLQAAINRFLDEYNAEPKRFIWTTDPDKIIAGVRRGHQVLAGVIGVRDPCR